MADIKVPWESWVVVCDGAKALIMRNAGNALLMNLQVHETLSQPGRAHAPDGTSGSAMEQTDWQEQAEADFLRRIAAKLDKLVRERNGSRIILVAPPKALGTLRPNLSAEAQAAISAEVPKDYTNMPVDEIERRLAA
jgi:protein required for attachment to host cells